MPILTQTRYTFSDYFELPYGTRLILAELGYHHQKVALSLPRHPHPDITSLQHQLQTNLKYTDLPNEASRRESLVFPILVAACEQAPQADINIEFPIVASDQFQGVVDYYLQGRNALLVVEAKQADLERGFTQLATEMIAFSQWSNIHSILYGAVTTGNIWKFGTHTASNRTILEDTQLYTLFDNLTDIVEILTGILS